MNIKDVLRVIGGGYLVYISYTLIKALVNEKNSLPPWAIYLSCIVFTIVGLILIFTSLRNIFRDKKNHKGDNNEREKL